MRSSLLVFVVVFAFLGGCKSKTAQPRAEEPAAASVLPKEKVDVGCPGQKDGSCGGEVPEVASAGSSQGTQSFGGALGGSQKVSLGELLASPAKFNEQTVTVSGHVRRACARKGCWLELAADEQKGSPSCRVTFKDYGFLVPTNSAGRAATLEGVVQLTLVPKETVAHYESEGATFANKEPDGTAHEVRMVATGVVLSGG
jgi:hypothetical protein